MKKLLKVLGWTVGVTLVLVVAAIVIIPLVVDPNDYKDKIATAVTDATGRDFSIDGDIGLSVFPRLAIDLGGVMLGNAPGFPGDFFARTQSVQVRVKLMPLLDREVEMDTVRIDGLAVNLARNAEGQTNWDDLLAGDSEQSADSAAPIAALALGGVALRNATLSWDDALTAQRVALNAINVDTGPVSLDAPLDISISFDVASEEQQLNGHVELTGELAYDSEAAIAAANGLTLNATIESPQIPGGKTDINFSGNARFDESKQMFALSGFNLLVPGLDFNGTAASVGIGGDLVGELETGRYSSDNIAIEGTLSGGDVPGKELPFKLTSGFDLNLNEQRLALSDFTVNAAELNGSGKLTVSQLLDAPSVEGNIQINQFSPRALLEKMGQAVPDTTDPNVLSALELDATISGTGDALSLQPFSAKLDDTSMKGNISVTGFAAPALRLDLAVDNLDADRYLPPASGATVANPGAAAPAATGLPLDTLRALDVDARLALGKLKVTGVVLEDIRVTLNAKDGLIKLSPLQAKLYGGSYTGSLALDARGDQVRIGLDEKLTGVHVGKLLAAVGTDTGTLDLSDAAGDLSLKSNVSGDPEKQTFVLQGTTVEANVAGQALPGGKLLARASADLNVDLAKQVFTGTNLTAAVTNLTLPSGLTTTGTLAASSVSANMGPQSFAATGLKVDLEKLKLNPKAPDMPLKIAAENVAANLGKQTAKADQFTVRTLGMNASGTVSAANLNTTPTLTGNVDVADFNPKRVLKQLGQPPIRTGDPKALSNASFKAAFEATPNSVKLDNLRAKLDETSLTGNLSIADLASPNGIRFDLTANLLNADRYLPPKAKGQGATPAAAAAALPLDFVKGLDAAGSLVIKKLIMSNLTLTDINLKIEGKDGVLNINPANALLYGGSYAGNIRMDARGKKGKLSVDERLKRVSIGPLLKDLSGEDRVDGRGDLRIKATAVGSNGDDLKRTLNGDTSITFKNGAIKGVDVVRTLCSGVAGLLGSSAGGGGETKFSDMSATAKIVNGVLDNRDFTAKSPLLRVSGAGTYDIPRDKIDYNAEASLVASCQGQGGLATADLGNLPPAGVRITGPASNPKYEFDLKGMLAGLGQRGGSAGDIGKTLGIEELEGAGAVLPALGGLGGVLGGDDEQTEQPVDQTVKKKDKKKNKKKKKRNKKKKQAEQTNEGEAIDNLLEGITN